MKTVAVIFGGRSAEHDVSIITAHIPIIESLKASGGYDIWPVYISKEGKWYSDKAMNDLAYFKDPGYEQRLEGQKPLQLSFENGLDLIWPSASWGMFKKQVHIDVVFPSMHGTYGEDGSLMGLLRMANVPFVGCDMFASAVAMDKVLTKQVTAAEGVPVVPYVWFTRTEWEKEAPTIRKKIDRLRRPLFVKPVHLGSSIGISKAKNDEELEQAIEVAIHYDDKVLVEEGVNNLIEVTLPIMGNDEPVTALIERPLNQTEFFDFSDKYLSGGKKSSGANTAVRELPAKISDELSRRVKEIGIKVYKTLGCSGIARVDFLIDSVANTVYMNEVNTLPGSLYHHNWKQAGVSSMELVTGLIKLAEDRFMAKKNTTVAFQSEILQKVGGPKVQ
ncbi:MAG: D-alanine--D-alanine ligase family protein [Candidatus Paceibacterota bacterium]